MKKMLSVGIGAALSLLAGCGGREHAAGAADPDARAWREFVGDVTNLTLAAELRKGTRMISTWDRTGGNDDFNSFAGPGSEPDWVALVDLKGPGVVRRFWTTGVDFGHPVKIYVDGEKTPRVSGRIEEVFGGRAPFTPPLSCYLNMAWLSYVPMTYQKSLRIEMLKPPVHPLWGPRRLFFQANVETLPAGARVESLPARLSAADTARLGAVAAAWSNAVGETFAVKAPATPVTVAAGAQATVLQLAGPARVDALRIRVSDESGRDMPDDAPDLLQQIEWRVSYDGAAEPSIRAPLGDFFLQHARRRTFGSLPMSSSPSGLVCRLPMPFARALHAEIINRSARAIRVEVAADVTQGAQPGLGYLHASWSQTGPQNGAPHHFAAFQGPGHLAGISLQVTGLENSWWILEGDEMFFVDGEQQPSWHGTGLEDYFNGAWYWRGAAFSGLHGLFDRAPFRLSTYRFQTVDPLSFEKSLSCRIERGDQNVSKGYFRSVTYAYLAAPSAAPGLPADAAQLAPPEHPLFRQTFMLQLTELERMNNFAEALALCREYVRRFPGAEENGVCELRALEYRRLLGEALPAADYQPFLDGKHGPLAAEQAKLLVWFHEKPGRALVGLNANGKTRLFLDGNPVLAGDHPYNLFVGGVELADGPHALCAEATMMRAEPWVLMGVRTHGGVAGTGPWTKSTRQPAPTWNATAGDTTAWSTTLPNNVLRGTPDAPMIGGIPNAFVLLPSKVFGIRAEDWGYYQGKGCFRVDFTTPLDGMPDFTPQVTGLPR